MWKITQSSFETFCCIAAHVVSEGSVTHLMEGAIYPLPHVYSNKRVWLVSVSVIDSREREHHPSLRESMTVSQRTGSWPWMAVAVLVFELPVSILTYESYENPNNKTLTAWKEVSVSVMRCIMYKVSKLLWHYTPLQPWIELHYTSSCCHWIAV